MVFSRLMEEQGGDFWTDAAISIMQGGGKLDAHAPFVSGK